MAAMPAMPDMPSMPKVPGLPSLVPGWLKIVTSLTKLGTRLALAFMRRPLTISVVNTTAIVVAYKEYRRRRTILLLQARSYGPLKASQVSSVRTAAKFDCTGQVVIVTGGTTGTGSACCDAFAAAGAAAVYNLDAVEHEHGQAPLIVFRQCDVRKPAEIERRIAEIADAHDGRVDCLVLNTVTVVDPPLAALTVEQFDNVIGGGVRHCTFAIKAVLPPMQRARHGNIVLVGPASTCTQKQPMHGMSLAALTQLATTSSAQYAPSGIRISCISVDAAPLEIAQAVLMATAIPSEAGALVSI